jgi:fibronectin type 3 domain-containing protein
MQEKGAKAPAVAIITVAVVVILVVAGIVLLPKPSAPTLDQPPTAPLNLTALPGDRTVDLSWQPPIDRGSAPVRNYRVYRGDAPGNLSMIRELGAVLNCSDTGLTNGQTYHYRVSAVSNAGEGARSILASATPGAAAGLPSEPRNLAARGGNTQVTLSWEAPSNTGGAPITGYRIYRGTASGQETHFTDTGSGTGYTNTGLTNGQTYFFQVSARNSAGEGPRSAEASAAPTGGPTAPSAPVNLTYVPGASSVTLHWEPPASDGGSMITGYTIYRGSTSGALLLLAPVENVTSYADEGLLPGLTLLYQVSAKNAIGSGPRTPELQAMPLSRPSAPQNLAATAGLGSVSLSWQPPASTGGSAIANYLVYRGTGAGAETFLVMLGAVTAYNDPGLINGTPYYYQVSCSNAQGESPRSNEATATPQASFDTPSAPRDLAAVDGDGRVDLAWSPPAIEGGAPVSKYTVYRDGAKLIDLGVVTTHSDTQLVNGQPHTYEVTASNSIGEGPKSGSTTATPARVPDAPAGLQAVPSNHNVSLSWLAPASDGGAPVTGYVLFRDGASFATLGAQTTYRDGAVTNGQSYVYKVAALNRKGQGAFSNEASATPDIKTVAFNLGGAGFDVGVDIGTDSLANFYVTGYFSGTVDFDPGTGASELSSAGETDIFVAKYDVDGNLLWAFRVGGAGYDRASAIQIEPGGAFRITGQFSLSADFDPGAGAAMLTSFGDLDAFAAGYASDGTYLWAAAWGGPGMDSASDISADSAGNAYITGTFSETVDFDPGAGTVQSASAGAGDIFVLSLGPAGAYRWHFACGSGQDDRGTGLQAYANGTFWLAGTFNGSVDLDPGAAVNLTNASGYTDIFLARYSSSGGFIWAGAIGGPENDTVTARCIAFDGPGNVYLTGAFQGLCDFLPTNQSANVQSNGGFDAFIAEYDPSGEYRWSYGTGGAMDDYGRSVAVDQSGAFYWTGHFRDTRVDFDLTADTYYLNSSSTGISGTIFLAKYLPGGILEWAYSFDPQTQGSYVTTGNAVCVDVNGNILMTGQFFDKIDLDPTSGTNIATSLGMVDVVVVRLGADGKPA